MSHYDEYYEEFYNELVKDTIALENNKKNNFINNIMNCTNISYEEAEQKYKEDQQRHNMIVSHY